MPVEFAMVVIYAGCVLFAESNADRRKKNHRPAIQAMHILGNEKYDYT